MFPHYNSARADSPVIHGGVLVDQQVPEPGGLLHGLCEILGEKAGFAEDGEHLGEAVRCP